jgi:hypothetical protein
MHETERPNEETPQVEEPQTSEASEETVDDQPKYDGGEIPRRSGE